MMNKTYMAKSSIDEIRERFDRDVDRFSDVSKGQEATMDAPVAMELITRAAVAATKSINRVLDVGCGAGNNTIKLMRTAGPFDCVLIDLSRPMLERARERIANESDHSIHVIQGDFRTADLTGEYDVIIAAAVLHHLRTDADWESAFKKLYALTAAGGSVWITDLVDQETTSIHDVMWNRYANYLIQLKGEAYRDEVFDYIEKEDSPRSVTYQLELLRSVGFKHVELLHKNGPFAAFGAIKPVDK